MINSRRASWLAAIGFVALALQLGCEEKPTSSPAPGSSGSAAPADTAMALDPNVTKALAASSGSAASKRGDGPPETGVFEPGAADAVQARGKPTEIKLGSEGAEPRVTLGGTAAFKGTAKVTVGIRMGPRNALPTVDFTIDVAPEKAEKGADAGAAGAATLIAVKKVELSSEQLGQVPEAAAKEIGKLKGSQIRVVRGPDGTASDLVLQLSKDAAPDLERLLAALGDALLAFEVPAPAKPVGVGAVWIAQTRNAYTGIDLVTYRMYKVMAIEGDQVTVSVEIKQYAAAPNLSFAGLPPGASLTQFESLGNGEMKLRKGESLAKEGRYASQLGLGLPGQGQNANRTMMLQLQSSALLSR